MNFLQYAMLIAHVLTALVSIAKAAAEDWGAGLIALSLTIGLFAWIYRWAPRDYSVLTPP